MKRPDHEFGCGCASHVARPWNRPEHWSKADVAYLEARFGRVTDESIAARLGRTAVGVRLKAKRLGLRKRDVGLSGRDVAGLLGADESAVSKLWIRHGLLAARRGFRIGGGRRQWMVTEAAVEAFIRDHGHWIDARRVPDESPFKALAMANAWTSLPEVAQITGHSVKWLLWYFKAGLFPVRRKAGRWYMPTADVSKLPTVSPAALDYARYAREESLARRRLRRKAA